MARAPFLLACVFATILVGACSMPSKPADSVPAASEVPPSSIPAASPADALACDSAKAQWTLGNPADAALLEKARANAGAELARILSPGQAVTMEYRAERLNLRVNEAGVVQSVNCG